MRDISEEFGINVRNTRIKKGMTQQDLADAADLDRTTISVIENGKGNPELLTIELLAKALKVNIQQLFIVDYEELEDEENE